ncbi:hypothetical protein HLV38_04930 [Berryella wangjianweii]|uniref:Cell wall binding repeat 2 n=1 Tax=Berryella wangjianweii TaxID=2734634 RepID=A0A6M8J4I2_9ACTN|nr:CotH kinase family protein [Berryella wangjianweii]QKF07533.1 hypothetical protein HLV38_04930 [Berryella wangjianweii]
MKRLLKPIACLTLTASLACGLAPTSPALAAPAEQSDPAVGRDARPGLDSPAKQNEPADPEAPADPGTADRPEVPGGDDRPSAPARPGADGPAAAPGGAPDAGSGDDTSAPDAAAPDAADPNRISNAAATARAFRKLPPPAAGATQRSTVGRIDLTLANEAPLSKVHERIGVRWDLDEVRVQDGLGSDDAFAGANMKGRGNSTWGEAKKPYQLKFKKKVNLFGMGPAKKWVLLANAFDPSLMRADVASSVAEQLGVAGTMRGKFIDLYVNGRHLGSYYVMHQVEVGSSSIDLSHERGALAEISNIHEPDEVFAHADDGTRILYKDSVANATEADERAAVSLITASYNRFWRAAKAGDWDELNRMADLDSWARWFLVQEFTSNPDAFASNFYLYQNGPDAPLCAGPAWDFDLALNNRRSALWGISDLGNPGRSWAYHDPRDTLTSSRDSNPHAFCDIYALLMDIPQFRALVTDRYRNQMKPALHALPAQMDATAQMIAEMRHDNDLMWKNGNGAAEYASLRSWIVARTAYLDRAYGERLAPESGDYVLRLSDGTSAGALARGGSVVRSDGEVPSTVTLEAQADGTYRISVGASVLGLESARREAAVQLGADRGNLSRWWMAPADNGACTLVNKATGLALSFGGAQAEAHALTNDPAQRVTLAPTRVHRHAGAVAISTSVEVSRAAYASSEHAIVVSREAYLDSIASLSLAGSYDCPILLCETNRVTQPVLDELERLGVRHVTVVGGDAVVGADAYRQLQAVPGLKVERLWGRNAMGTAAKVAERVFQREGRDKGAVVATIAGYHDALSISSYCFRHKVPVLLSADGPSGRLSDEEVKLVNSTTGRIIVTGGEAAVCRAAAEDTFVGRDLVRLGGRNAFDTSNQIATYLVNQGLLRADAVSLATGNPESGGTDALVGSVIAGKADHALVLCWDDPARGLLNDTVIQGGPDSEGAPSFIGAHLSTIARAHIMGGTACVTAETQTRLDRLLTK